MSEKEELLKKLNGKTDEEKKQILTQDFKIYWEDHSEEPCKVWYAKVFTYCKSSELEEKLNFFLYLINTFGYLWHICFNEENTVYLGCTCPCGNQQTILYYSLAYNH